jgi:hypothetical protein
MLKALAPGQVAACTGTYPGLAALLFVEAKLGLPFGNHEEPPDALKEIKAIWDTGASASVISDETVAALGLTPTGMTRASTANGECDVYTYLLSLFLPNQVCVPALKVSGGTLKDFDMLIGMDVIRSGDFAVTNFEGKTVCTFRMPSLQCIDFVKDTRPGTAVVGAHPSRNQLCPCGSGKKYKKCCGLHAQ